MKAIGSLFSEFRWRTRPHLRLTAAPLAFAVALATGLGPSAQASSAAAAPPAASTADRASVVRAATAMIGVPYRYGGSSPRGFDCSGLVVYSYAKAGLRGLPHSAAALKRRTRSLPVSKLEPGDLLFFRLGWKRTSHVAIYVGDRTFVHAPSSGKRVEKVSLDHLYWEPRLEVAGRLEF